MNIVGISGGLSAGSRTRKLTREILEQLQRKLPGSHQLELVSLAQVAPSLSGAIWRSQLNETLEAQLQRIEAADLLVIACPVYRASYPGLFKHFLDFIERKGFEKKLVLLGACGGSLHHSLIIEQQLRPLISGLGAFTAPTGIFAEAKDFDSEGLTNPQVFARIDTVVDEALQFFAPRDTPVAAVEELVVGEEQVA